MGAASAAPFFFLTEVVMRLPVFVAAFVLSAAFASQTLAQIADDPHRAEALRFFRVGQELLSSEQFEKAIDAFSEAVKNDRLLSIAHYGIGQANMNLRRYASATKAYMDCIEAMRVLHDIEQTNKFEVDRRREDEIRELRTVLNQSTRGTPAPARLQFEQRLRDLEEQKRSIGTAFRPPSEVLLALGSAQFRNGDRDAAEANWRAAVEVNPSYGEAHNNLAVIYMQSGRLPEAEQELKLAEKNGFNVNPQFKTDLKERQRAAKSQ
jgi:tetratricopeptide (TPR) repeat protein